jgi:hypothetical protein
MPRDFDKERWLSEALRRYLRSKDTPTKRKRRLRSDVLAIDGLDKLTCWCKSQAIDFLFVNEPSGTWSTDARTVYVTCNASPTYQLIIALHECGHALVETINEEEFAERYSNGYMSEESTAFSHRIECLAEEIEAWYRGWDLARELGMSIDRDVFIACRNKLLKSYVHWTLRLHK